MWADTSVMVTHTVSFHTMSPSYTRTMGYSTAHLSSPSSLRVMCAVIAHGWVSLDRVEWPHPGGVGGWVGGWVGGGWGGVGCGGGGERGGGGGGEEEGWRRRGGKAGVHNFGLKVELCIVAESIRLQGSTMVFVRGSGFVCTLYEC